VVGSKAPVVGSKAPAIGSKAPAIGSKAPVVGNKAHAAGNKAPAAGRKAAFPLAAPAPAERFSPGRAAGGWAGGPSVHKILPREV
jgi:hypothetical protein